MEFPKIKLVIGQLSDAMSDGRDAVPRERPVSLTQTEPKRSATALLGSAGTKYVGVLISLWLFLFPICSIRKLIFLGWVKEVTTTKS
jgi:hypothetical protein